MSKRTRLTVKKIKNDEKSFNDLVDMLLALHAEGGFAKFNADKAAEVAYRTIDEGMTFVARMGGKPVGTLALSEATFWYGDDTFLHDIWFWVDPAHRAKDIGVALLKAAKAEAEARNKIVLVSVINPDRRPKATTATLLSQMAGYVPLGYTLNLR